MERACVVRPRSRLIALSAAALGVLGVPALSAVPASAAAHNKAANRVAERLDQLLAMTELETLGLSVQVSHTLIGATGPASIIQHACTLFSVTGAVCVYTGVNETGTGLIALTGSPSRPFSYNVLTSAPAGICNVEDDTTSDYTTIRNDTGTLVGTEDPDSDGNIPCTDASRAVWPSATTPDPLVPEIAELYRNDRVAHDARDRLRRCLALQGSCQPSGNSVPSA